MVVYRSLSELAGTASGNGRSPSHVGSALITASGHRFVINEGFPSGSIDGRVQSLPDGHEDPDTFPNLPRYVHRDRIRAASVHWGLEERSYMHGSGKHEGGYHPGKNKRQGASIRFLGQGDVAPASRLFGFPSYELVAADLALQQIAERRGADKQNRKLAYENRP